MSAGRPLWRSPAPIESPLTTFRTLPGLAKRQTPMFAKCSAHADTGATTSSTAPPPAGGSACGEGGAGGRRRGGGLLQGSRGRTGAAYQRLCLPIQHWYSSMDFKKNHDPFRVSSWCPLRLPASNLLISWSCVCPELQLHLFGARCTHQSCDSHRDCRWPT